MKRFLAFSALGSTAYALYGWSTTLPERQRPCSPQEQRQMDCCEEAMLHDRGI